MNALKMLGMALVASVVSFSVQAELLDQFSVANSEFANANKNGTVRTSVSLLVEGAGVERKVSLSHSQYSYTQGIDNYWRGDIAASDVTVNGIGQISVNVNTCAYTANRTWGEDACGRIDVTFTKGNFLWRTNGSTTFDWAPLTNTIIGGVTTFSADVSGFVKGVDMVGALHPAMGKYTNVKVAVELPDAAN